MVVSRLSIQNHKLSILANNFPVAWILFLNLATDYHKLIQDLIICKVDYWNRPAALNYKKTEIQKTFMGIRIAVPYSIELYKNAISVLKISLF